MASGHIDSAGDSIVRRGAVISVDASCSGRKAACAAVLSIDGRIVAERSRFLRDIDGYTLAAELAAVVLAADVAEQLDKDETVVVEVDNPDVPRVILEGYRPRQAHRIPPKALDAANEFATAPGVNLRLLPRNSTPGLRRAHRLSSRRLWQ